MSTESLTSMAVLEDNPYLSGRYKNILGWAALCLEVMGGILVTVLALYIRLAHLEPPVQDLNWQLFCSDMRLYEKKVTYDNTTMLYVIILAVPTMFILIGEVEFALMSKKSYFEKMDKMQRMSKNLPRMMRIYAMFFIGTMLASFTADYIKILIVSPKPYFLTAYGGNCPLAYNGTKTDDFYDALKSFPSHLSSVAGFTCVFAIGYAHKVRMLCSTPLLTPIMTHGFLVLAVTISLDRYTSHFAHTLDILAGLLIGLVLAVYMSNLLVFVLQPKSKENYNYRWLNFLDFMIPRVSMPPTYSAETRNARSINTQMSSKK